MNELVIKDIYSEVFQYLGDMQSSVDNALGNYAVEEINEKIAELSVKVQVWEDRYGCAFDVFSTSGSRKSRTPKAANTPIMQLLRGKLSLVSIIHPTRLRCV